ncbi:MAG: hypothetical protein DRN15_04080 [Thermoprotei archaeon]|nr:MAG: hypothetical protein DRN15_04080 [Thermoprotei archaeon]RLF25939.1 MAG: hypothetical protein DRM97_00080 [Thermoprotei archaeon]
MNSKRLEPEVYEGRLIKVHLMPGCILIEVRSSEEAYHGLSMEATGLYMLEYDDILNVKIENEEVVLLLRDGSSLRLEVDRPIELYSRIKHILASIETFRGRG